MAIEIVDLRWFTQLLAMVDLSIVFLYVYQRVIQQTTGGGDTGMTTNQLTGHDVLQ